jgi:hypothetical protein
MFSQNEGINSIIDKINGNEGKLNKIGALIKSGVIREITASGYEQNSLMVEKEPNLVLIKGNFNSKNVQCISNNGSPIILKSKSDAKTLPLVAEIYIPKEYLSNIELKPDEFKSHFVDGYFVYPELAWNSCLDRYKDVLLPNTIDIKNNCLTALFHIGEEGELSIREKDLILFYPNAIPAKEKINLLLDSNLNFYTFAFIGGCVSPAEISFSKHLDEKYYKKIDVVNNKIKSNLLRIFFNEIKSDFDFSKIPSNYLETISKLEEVLGVSTIDQNDSNKVTIAASPDNAYVKRLKELFEDEKPNMHLIKFIDKIDNSFKKSNNLKIVLTNLEVEKLKFDKFRVSGYFNNFYARGLNESLPKKRDYNAIIQQGKIINFPKQRGSLTKTYHRKMLKR